jgi:hypothetical protein
LATAATVALTLIVVTIAPSSAATKSTRVKDGVYAPKASNKTPYSNGAVDITVYDSGRKIKASQSGVACYTGATPPTGVPSDDEVTIHFPHALTIGASKTFSFSGPVTLTAEEAQSTAPIATTFTLKGRFVKGKHGTYTAQGTDASPICQASTPTHFASPFAGV